MENFRFFFSKAFFILLFISSTLTIFILFRATPSLPKDKEIHTDQSDIELIPGSILVRFIKGTPNNLKAQARGKINGPLREKFKIVDRLGHVKISRFTVDAAIEMLARLPFEEYAEPDFVITLNQTFPNDANFNLLWGVDQYRFTILKRQC